MAAAAAWRARLRQACPRGEPQRSRGGKRRQFLEAVLAGQDRADVIARGRVHQQRPLAGRDQISGDFGREAGCLDQGDLFGSECPRRQLAKRRYQRAPLLGRKHRDIAQDSWFADRQHPVDLAEQPRHQGRADVANVENPAGVGSHRPGNRFGDLRPRHDHAFDRAGKHPVVKEARVVTGLAVHLH